MKTLTVGEVVRGMGQMILDDPKVAEYKVYISSDPEGNSYGNLTTDMSFSPQDEDKVVLIYPVEQKEYEELTS